MKQEKIIGITFAALGGSAGGAVRDFICKGRQDCARHSL